MNRNDYIKISLLALVVLVSGADAATLTVDVSGSANYMKIQDAINASSAGDTILVYSGTYYENVDVNKPLILRGIDSGGGKPVVNASRGNAINLNAGNGTVELFSVTTGGWPYTGIYVNSNNNNIKNNNIKSNNGYGIFIVHSSGNTLKGNYVENSSIRLDYSDNNMLDSNIALNSAYGIVLNSSNNNTLSNNTAWNNWYGITLVFSSNNKLTNNNASNNGNGIGISYSSNYNKLSGNTAKSNIGSGILLSTQSNYNSLNGNNIWDNKDGIHLYLYSNNNTLNNNNASNNRNGIVLSDSMNNTIISNIVNGNGAPNNHGSGITTVGNSRNNTLSSNIVSNNFAGISIGSFKNNNIHNNFFNNTNNFVFNPGVPGGETVNIWNITKIVGTNIISGPYLGGNVWANPNGTGFSQTCADSDRDEICDSPYKLDNYYVDQLPLAYKPGYYGHGLNVFSTGTPEEGSTEKAGGFEVVLAMTTLSTIYLLRRKRG